MPSIEERLKALERAIRLQNRERAVQRALYVSSQQDIHDRLEDLEVKVDKGFADIDARFADVDARFATLEADNRAILEILREQYKKPGPAG